MLGVNLFVLIHCVQTVVLFICYNKSLCMHDFLNNFALLKKLQLDLKRSPILKLGTSSDGVKLRGQRTTSVE